MIRQANVSPGGGIEVGALHLHVLNYYTYSDEAEDAVNEHNELVVSLMIGTEDMKHVISVPITEKDCLALAHHFLDIAVTGDCWPT